MVLTFEFTNTMNNELRVPEDPDWITDEELDSLYEALVRRERCAEERRRQEARDNNKLPIVAMLMDEWTRAENIAYANVLKEKQRIIEHQRKYIQRQELLINRYISRLNQMAAVITEQDLIIDMAVDSNRENEYAIEVDPQGVPYVVMELYAMEELDEH